MLGCVLLIIMMTSLANADSSAPNNNEVKPSSSTLKNLLSYRSPSEKKEGTASVNPNRLNGGGTREVNLDTLQPFQLLAPNHTALTSKSQPVVYWFVSSDEVKTVTLTLLQDGNDKPLIEKTIEIKNKGLQQIDLATFGVSLQPNSEYRISLDGLNFSSVTLRYQAPDSSIKSLQDKAQAGYWYDVLQQSVTNHSPETNDLLQQIGIYLSVL